MCMLYFHTMLGSSVSMHGNFHTPKSICCARVKCLHTWKFPYTQKYTGQVFACMEISIHPKVYGSSVCLHGNFHTPKSICRARVKCLPAWKFPYTQKYMPCSGQVFACMEISIHPKVYAVLGSSVCMHGNFHTPKSLCRTRVKCLHAWKFPYTQTSMP